MKFLLFFRSAAMLSSLEDAGEKMTRCKTLGHMIAESACRTSQLEGIFPDDNIYNVGNMIFDCSKEAKDILTQIYCDLKDLIRKTKDIK